MTRLDVVAIGELNPDLILAGMASLPRLGEEILARELTFTLGSSTALCAANLAALGLAVGIVGKVGEDLFGRFVLDALAERGVDASHVVRDPAVRTGFTVSLTYPSDRAMITFSGAMADLAAREVDLDYLRLARHLHVSSLFLQRALQPGLPELFRMAREAGLTTSLDPAWDPVEAWDAGIDRLYSHLDVLFANRVEVCALARQTDWRTGARRLAEQVPLLVIKGGADGATTVQRHHWQDHQGYPVKAVDPTGAGDAFDAGFLFAFLAGRPPADCARWGNACGAMTAAQPGGSGAFRTRGEVEAFMTRGDACAGS